MEDKENCKSHNPHPLFKNNTNPMIYFKCIHQESPKSHNSMEVIADKQQTKTTQNTKAKKFKHLYINKFI